MSWASDWVHNTFGGTEQSQPISTQPQQTALGSMSADSTAIGQHNLGTFEGETAEDRANNSAIAKNLADTSSFTLGNMKDASQRWKDKFVPLEDDMISTAQHYADPGNMDRMRGRAMAGVAQSFDAQRANAMGKLESYGINPGATRYAALDTGVRAAQAAAMAAAGNQSDLTTEATARALKQQAIGTGQTDEQIALGQGNLGVSAGATGANTNNATTANQANILGTANAWYNTASGIMNNAGNLAIGTAKVNNDAAKNNQTASSGVGAAIGAGANFLANNPEIFMAAHGGAIPDPNKPFAGQVSPDASPTHGQAVDDVDARLTAGEFVMPKDVTQWFGHKHFQNMIKQARTAMSGGGNAKPQAIPMGA